MFFTMTRHRGILLSLSFVALMGLLEARPTPAPCTAVLLG